VWTITIRVAFGQWTIGDIYSRAGTGCLALNGSMTDCGLVRLIVIKSKVSTIETNSHLISFGELDFGLFCRFGCRFFPFHLVWFRWAYFPLVWVCNQHLISEREQEQEQEQGVLLLVTATVAAAGVAR